MTSKRSNSRDSDRARARTGSTNAEHIRSRDVARVKSSSPTGSEGRDRPPMKAKMNGSDRRLGVSGETVVAKDCLITEDPRIALLRKIQIVLPFQGLSYYGRSR
ncbi:hypothetical protein F2Q70_00026780 [Brassica cretica]|uniref:Uncharacterized protein n=1 Tax=Brassica cretica TaxID=69181 RepID=A0A8S9L5I8_BRACR|nr:hypothetical protein F2Q70_00026780 [Brassica cretica]